MIAANMAAALCIFEFFFLPFYSHMNFSTAAYADWMGGGPGWLVLPLPADNYRSQACWPWFPLE